MTYALVLIVGFVAGTVSGIVGTGATIILLPILVFAFGPREAVPIMAIVALMSNFAKITSWWRQIDWRAVAAYALGGIPAAALGARTLLILPERIVDIALGLFFLAMVPGRRWLATRNITLGFGGLAVAGAVIGFLTTYGLATLLRQPSGAPGPAPEGMVWVPGGVCWRGSDTAGHRDALPWHQVEVDGFWMDVNTVTNEQFERFVQLGVSVLSAIDFAADARFDAEFFAQFACESLFRRLARLDLSSRKLPKQSESRTRAALADEQFAV